tara:strand:- start:238 stop:534 length:297 start_codon:yes stop_codon:yes gene_type:complete
MKKLLGIVVLCLLFSNISYSKISKVYYDELYDYCMIEAMKADLGYTITKNYCKCSADHFDDNYNDNSLIELVEGEGGAVYNDVVAFVINKCRRKVGLE